MRVTLSRFIRQRFCSNLQKYVIDSRIGGYSEEGLYEVYAGKFDNQALLKMKKKIMEKSYGTTIITTPEECFHCLNILKKVKNIVAWDTETMDLDVKNESPIGKGKILCASFFAGPEFNFGNGPKVFIDNFGTNAGLINIFKEYLESDDYLKVWHNYGFDRHIFYNHGINVKGFGGDTMQMARLYDSSKMFGGYSLSALTKDYQAGIKVIVDRYMTAKEKELKLKISKGLDSFSQEEIDEAQRQLENLAKYEALFNLSSALEKTKLEHIFRRKKILKNGVEGKVYEYPTTLTMHTQKEHIEKWIDYSVLDSESTYFLREALELALKCQKSKEYPGISNIWQIYEKYWRPFGEILTDMEREGFKINLDYMRKIEEQANEKIINKKKEFMDFIFSFQDDQNIDYFNPSSNAQMQQLLHAPYKINESTINRLKKQKEENESEELAELSEEAIDDEIKKNRKIVTEIPLINEFDVDNNDKSRGNAKIKMNVKGLGIPPVEFTSTGLPSVDASSLIKLAGSPKNGKYGLAYDHFLKEGNEEFGKKLCEAIETLLEHRNTETLLKTFIEPLQKLTDETSRVHCSLNINTETGRLSSRKPNLQNQPALEKDTYKIRSAFTCEKGNKLIVADYGQLELRVLAHLSNCKAMIKAFKEGGDFHSRTAIGMFDYIKKDIQEGKVLLEWDKSQGDAPVPLLKDKYASERRKAKTVNFSIAYGKTAKGFAADWNCTEEEAIMVIKSWFQDRPEVEAWQKEKQKIAKQKKLTQTLLGRHRSLEKFFGDSKFKKGFMGMGLRRAINTPIQGGAADIVIASMIKISQNKRLKELGWKLILQIHDELILEGPEGSAKEAFEIVKYNMSHPFENDLLVELEVDAKIGETWYECK